MQKTNYLLIHRTGLATIVSKLQDNSDMVAIINLTTMEQFIEPGVWDKVPQGYDVFHDYDTLDDDDDDDDDDTNVIDIQRGSKRYYNPYLIWAYAKSRF